MLKNINYWAILVVSGMVSCWFGVLWWLSGHFWGVCFATKLLAILFALAGLATAASVLAAIQSDQEQDDA